MLCLVFFVIVCVFFVFVVEVYCDGFCGVYDLVFVCVVVEVVLFMIKKLKVMEVFVVGDVVVLVVYNNIFGCYVVIKEEEVQKIKKELLIFWIDYFKFDYLVIFFDLYDIFWKVVKFCSVCKVNIDQVKVEELMVVVEKIYGMFWQFKGCFDVWVIVF